MPTNEYPLSLHLPSHQFQTQILSWNPNRRQRGAGQWPYTYTQTQVSFNFQEALSEFIFYL